MKLILEVLTNRQLFFKEKSYQSTCQHEQKYNNDYMYMYTHIIRLGISYMVNNHNRYVIYEMSMKCNNISMYKMIP